MARPKEDKSKRKKKRKSRTQVEISSSESESDAPQQIQKSNGVAKVNKQADSDVPMTDAQDAVQSSSAASSPEPAASAAAPEANVAAKDPEEFSSIYLRKVTVELADDLDKVRDAQDFKASSLPMLVHALRQGASIYSPDEKRRVLHATT